MRIKTLLIGSIFCLLIGCSSMNNDTGNENESPETDNTSYNSTKNHPDPLKKDRTKQRQENTRDTKNRDIFTNDTSIEIQETLTNRSDIRRAQVAITNTRAMISLQLSDHANRDGILDSVENDVKHIVPEKEIVIYTDDSYWRRMKDLGSRLKRLTDDDDIDKYIDEHFME